MKIALVHQKGGCGKSTTALLIAAALAESGHKVGVLDWDRQGTATRALDVLKKIMSAKPGQEYDHLIYDTPPDLAARATAAAIAAADVVLIPCGPSPADIWELDTTIATLEKNGKGKHAVVFTRVKASTLLSRNLHERAPCKALRQVVSERESYKHFLGLGWKALDSAAKEEVLGLTLEAMSIK